MAMQWAIVLRLSLVQSLQLIESEMPIRDPIVCTIKVWLYFHNVAMSWEAKSDTRSLPIMVEGWG